MSDKTDQRLRLTLRQLEVFAATAHGGSTRAAADRVARSQSAASTALADLESQLGVALFDRIGRRLVLNENGRTLLPRVTSLLDHAAELEHFFSDVHAAPLRVAASFTIGEYLLPGLIASWKALHPRSQVRLTIANSSDVLDAVSAFEVDLGFVEGQRTHPDLLTRRWLKDEMIVVASPRHALAGAVVSRTQLANAIWILREPGSGTRESSDRWLLAQLGQIRVELELGSNEAVKRAVASGLGLGCLSRHAVAHAIEEGWLVELRTRLPALHRTLGLVTHRGKQLGPAAQAFVQHCMAARLTG
jgi:DNA-binding transcriptional LysR family regulator